MLKTGVLRTGIHHTGESQLLDTMKTLHHGVCHHLHDEPFGYIDKTEYGVVDNLTCLHLSLQSTVLTPSKGWAGLEDAVLNEFGSHLLLHLASLFACYSSKVLGLVGINDGTA